MESNNAVIDRTIVQLSAHVFFRNSLCRLQRSVLLEMMGHSAEAVFGRVTLPFREKFNIIGKNKGISMRRKTTDITSNTLLFSRIVNQIS